GLGPREEEPGRVRAGRRGDAPRLEPKKTELARLYTAGAACVKANNAVLSRTVPRLLADLRRRHEEFQALLQINLAVLATAHAVSEGIIRGVASEVARKSAPRTYGMSGRANEPGHSPIKP